ncbi:Extracellular xylan exo-alpha-(1-_2)-glucuronosidase [termite gut metagenome]|uniref:Extracellular xylan exo-alpha-(1->2)-glucuronosidase n=1 Tax=termite gut metagenome TaxID=433724 RepID=A0A5J4SLW4_9ZZZZ
MCKLRNIWLSVFLLGYTVTLFAEDGSRLWLRAETNVNAEVKANKKSPTIDIAIEELHTQWKGAPVQLNIVPAKKMPALGNDGYAITGNTLTGISISAPMEQGLLYGAYHLLRLQAAGNLSSAIDITESPSYAVRIINHWDHINGPVTRGYAGHSIWKWNELPDTISPRYKEYARANASIGINGISLVSVPPQMFNADFFKKLKAIADIFRPYHIKVYLGIGFSSPMAVGDLKTADPLNKDVRKWWRNKMNELYSFIPDFGGFVIKANSEGASGPQDFGRTHLDGANMIADAIAPHNGIIMWRAFVYHPTEVDRAKQAYQEFMPFDGQFRSNVIIQVKNGPIDFQPREPFSPLFGAMQKTPVMIEFQITQEYLGFSNHLAYLGTTYEECLKSDTYARGANSTVGKATDGTLFNYKLTAIAGIGNVGEDINWCGHHFAQANWYVFGRMAWNNKLTAEDVAREWLQQTFTNKEFVEPVLNIMLRSREAIVDYMMPLGLHHLFAWDHHYGPEPWCDVPGARHDWLPSYYHKADKIGLGFNRSVSGSNAVEQYFQPLRDEYNNIEQCDERYLLWFHHVSWIYKMKSGRTLWDELCYHYDQGVKEVRDFQKIWDAMEPYVDTERFAHIQSKLRIQAHDAVWWKDACLLYFQTFSQKPIPYDIERPIHNLDDLMKIKLDLLPHN